MSGQSRQHDRELLDALESHPSEAFSGVAWRVTVKGRDALRGSTAGGRWSPPGEFEVLYTSLARAGALA
jgi:RES domain-containing protein